MCPLINQTYANISFLPCKNATADEDGFYGFVRVLGTYDNLDDCRVHVRKYIKDKGINKIYTVKTGKYVPLTTCSAHSTNSGKIDRNETDLKYQDLLDQISQKEQRMSEELNERREQVLNT